MKYRVIGLTLALTGCNPSQTEDNFQDNMLVNIGALENDNMVDEVIRNAANEGSTNEPLAEASSSIISLPSFDTEAYCRKIGDTAGGSYSIEAGCRDNETEALDALQSMKIPDRMMEYCTRIGEAAGGSYSIFRGCVENEADAAARL